MSYLERYDTVRDNPSLLLDGARTLIVSAFSFGNRAAVANIEQSGIPRISEYALGADYHIELRRQLRPAAKAIENTFGGRTRVCIDTAPLRERYWAARAGLGFIGVNNHLIIPGMGAHFFLATILWTGITSDGSDTPCLRSCGSCGRCVEACPARAISPDGRLDARRCLSYLTIESRDPLPPDVDLGGRLFGCDTCRRVCPHEPADYPDTTVTAFAPRPQTTTLTADDWRAMTPERFRQLFGDSPLARTSLPRLQANL